MRWPLVRRSLAETYSELADLFRRERDDARRSAGELADRLAMYDGFAERFTSYHLEQNPVGGETYDLRMIVDKLSWDALPRELRDAVVREVAKEVAAKITREVSQAGRTLDMQRSEARRRPG